LLYTNADCLTNKLDELNVRIEMAGADIVIVTEVKPKNFIIPLTDKNLLIEGFSEPINNLEGRGRL
jgi:hypothetical protein